MDSFHYSEIKDNVDLSLKIWTQNGIDLFIQIKRNMARINRFHKGQTIYRNRFCLDEYY